MTATQKSDALNQLLDQAESVEISDSVQNNATVKSLAIINVLNQILMDYGDAIGSKVDLTNMANMNMDNSSSMSSGSMSGMQGMSGMSSTIVDNSAYQSAQDLTIAAQSMFNDLKSMSTSDTSVYLDKIGNSLSDLQQAIGAKESGNDVMMIVHTKIHPNFISAFTIQVVPEFPMPALLVMISFITVLVMFRYVPKLHWQQKHT